MTCRSKDLRVRGSERPLIMSSPTEIVAKDERSLVPATAADHLQPEIDRWSKICGRTPGNGKLMSICKSRKLWLMKLGVTTRSLPYRVVMGGNFLKDEAAPAGLGVIGKIRMPIVPERGPLFSSSQINRYLVYPSPNQTERPTGGGPEMLARHRGGKDANP
jgi:hypothetical protein